MRVALAIRRRHHTWATISVTLQQSAFSAVVSVVRTTTTSAGDAFVRQRTRRAFSANAGGHFLDVCERPANNAPPFAVVAQLPNGGARLPAAKDKVFGGVANVLGHGILGESPVMSLSNSTNKRGCGGHFLIIAGISNCCSDVFHR